MGRGLSGVFTWNKGRTVHTVTLCMLTKVLYKNQPTSENGKNKYDCTFPLSSTIDR
jgi:hypothetical protein